ncbi:hypothetical protein V1634_27560 [Plantactinospora veratri]|uniref:Secreted protein n=1 Tax=Plantactinospora veratri TaxID=1436122 RepID=A0ABU7SFS1_9ACTN
MRRRRFLSYLLTVALAAVGIVTVANPAAAAPPSLCTGLGFTNGRYVSTNNAKNGNGAHLAATLCWQPLGGSPGMYHTYTYWRITDNAANGAGATIRLEWLDFNDRKHYRVPENHMRAWEYGETEAGGMTLTSINSLYVRACLTNTNSPAHHCGPAA